VIASDERLATASGAAGVRTASGRQLWAVVLTLAAVVAIYWFFITLGRGTDIPRQTQFYNLLAEAFLHGQLHLLQAPDPELLKKANPFDGVHTQLWLYDASLYQGRYYTYWGPVPALLLAFVKLFIGRTTYVGDELVVLAFVVGRVSIGALLLLGVRKHLFPRLAPLWVVPALAVFGLASPYLFTLGRPAIYEAAIEGGQFFLLLGVWAAFSGVTTSSSRRARWLLSLAGLAWGAALACRISLLLAVAALVAWTAFCPFGLRAGVRALALRFATVAGPVALVGFLLALYNFARFGAWSEFGLRYQLNPLRLDYSLACWAPNLHSYFVRRVLVGCQFPFIDAPSGAVSLMPASMNLAKLRYLPLEPVVGLFVAAPVTLFGLIAIGSALKELVRTRALQREHGAPREIALWLTGSALILAIFPVLPALGFFSSTMRYLADFASGWLLLGTLGFWTLLARLREQRVLARVSSVVAGALAAYTLVFGVLLGFQGGYYRAFKRVNPGLYDKLSASLSVCK